MIGRWTISKLGPLPLFLPMLLGAALASTPALADEARCAVRKLSALSKSEAGLLRCQAKGALTANPPDPACETQMDQSLTERFDGAVAGGGCAATGETPAVLTALHTLKEELEALLVVSPEGGRCASVKLRSVARRARKELSCRRRSASAGLAFDPACVVPAQADLVRRFERRELRADCATTGDAGAAESFIAGFLHSTADWIGGVVPVPLPTDLTAVISGGNIDLEWTAVDPLLGYTESRVVRALNVAPTGPDDGTATVVFEGAGTVATDDLTALLPTTTGAARTYHYAVYACDTGGSCENVGSHTTLTPTITQAMRAGGYVVHWRHASANVCADRTDLGTAATTMVPDWWKSCDSNCATTTARQLNAAGRAEAPAIGADFASLGIVIGRVLTSEFCRNVETAVLLNFGPVIEETTLLTYFVYDEAARCANTFALMSVVPDAGTNTALIGHSVINCEPLSTLAWSEAAIFKPDGMGGTTFIQRVTATAWATLP